MGADHVNWFMYFFLIISFKYFQNHFILTFIFLFSYLIEIKYVSNKIVKFYSIMAIEN